MVNIKITYRRHCAWSFRQLESWTEKDVRFGADDVLVWHPIVTKPDKTLFTKQWQPYFFENKGRVAGRDTTIEECGRKEAIITRNIGSFGKNDFFRAYTRTRATVEGDLSSSGKKRRNKNGDWVEMTGNVRVEVDMDEEWFQSVLKRDYVKILDSTEAEILEGILDMELSYKAAESYNLFCRRYKEKYVEGKPRGHKEKKKVEANVPVEKTNSPKPVEVEEDEEDTPAPKRRKRKDAGKSRARITNLRLIGQENPARQIKYNGKWHGLQEVNINIVLLLSLILFVGKRLVCLSLV